MNKTALSFKNLLKPKSKEDQQKISFKQFVWLGFNYTATVGFAFTLVTIFSGPDGVGLHMLWIFVLGSIVAGIVAWSYAKCSALFPEKKGGGFQYTFRTFGPFHGWMAGFYQYITVPVKATTMLFIVISVTFDGLYDPLMWGENTQLYLNLISILVYLAITSLALLGTRTFKTVSNIISISNWLSILILYICAIIIIARTNGGHFTEISEITKLTFTGFNQAFVSLFFAFTGFETFMTIGSRVKDHTKTMPKALVIILACSLAFYLVSFLIVIGAIGILPPSNPLNYIIKQIIGIAGLVIFSMMYFARMLNRFLNGAYYSGTMLKPLADAEMITPKISKLNKKGVETRALLSNIILTLIFSFILIILPYILKNNLNFSKLLQFVSIILFVINGYVVSTAVYLAYKKILKTNYWMITLWCLVLGFLLFEIIFYIIRWDSNQIPIITFASFTLLAIIWYFIYIRKKYKDKPRPALPKPYLEREAEEKKLMKQKNIITNEIKENKKTL